MKHKKVEPSAEKKLRDAYNAASGLFAGLENLKKAGLGFDYHVDEIDFHYQNQQLVDYDPKLFVTTTVPRREGEHEDGVLVITAAPDGTIAAFGEDTSHLLISNEKPNITARNGNADPVIKYVRNKAKAAGLAR